LHRTPQRCSLRGRRRVHLQTRPAEELQLEFVTRAEAFHTSLRHFDRGLLENPAVCGTQRLEGVLVNGDTVDPRKEDDV
jgi:hypothetical protein